MNISDPDLRSHVEKVGALVVGFPDHLRPVVGLFDALDFYFLREGESSPRVQEAIRILLSDELRPGLRDWYQRAGDNINQYALEWRERLSRLAGERLGSFDDP